MLFLAGADHERYGKVKWTRRYLLGHRRILKKEPINRGPVGYGLSALRLCVWLFDNCRMKLFYMD